MRCIRVYWWEHLINVIATFLGAWALTMIFPKLSYFAALVLMIVPVWLLLYWVVWHYVNGGDNDNDGSDGDDGEMFRSLFDL